MKNPDWQKCIIMGDSRDVIKRIPDNSIDFILTDPPYNLGQHSTGNIPLPGRSAMNNDVAEWDMVDFNPEEWAEDFIRILKPTGNLFIFTSYNQIGRWYNCLDHRFDTSNFMVWHKTNPAPKIFKAGFLNSCEMVFTCWNKKHTWNFSTQKDMHNFIESPICMRPERLSDPKHPTQKPVSILKRMIEIATNAGDIVFDPFMGVGSTGVAAIELQRRFIGIELDSKYFYAAKNRIDNIVNRQVKTKMSDNMIVDDSTASVANEPVTEYGGIYKQLNLFFDSKPTKTVSTIVNRSSGLSPIIKWPGGKEKELKYIIPNLPMFKRYFEPFVGGGSVFMGINAEEYYINDISSELADLYRNIAMTDENFFKYVNSIDYSWRRAEQFFIANPTLCKMFQSYRERVWGKAELTTAIHTFCESKQQEIMGIIGTEFCALPDVIVKETEKNLLRKMLRMHELEQKKHKLPDNDVADNILTAIKSAVYMNYRNLYNNKKVAECDPKLHSALFFFIRNYAYSGMFRYSKKGEFNVPYGGIAYNSKTMYKKLEYYKSQAVRKHFERTKIFSCDFECFLNKCSLQTDDFVFLDPPYDSEFSTYAQNAFTQEDQRRLAHYLINVCPAKWMMIIKHTDFIYNLYDRAGISIKAFDKEYLVSFMNRNEKKATHLLITNY